MYVSHMAIFEYMAIVHNECPVYETKKSNGEAPVMLELLGMQSTLSLLLLPGLLWPER